MPPDSTASRGPISRGGHTGEVLRLLVVDESRRDRALVREALQAGFPEAEIREIQHPSELSPVLDEGAFDLVLADHRPGWIDAFLLLARVRDRYPHIPVLLCTGTGSEELAVAAMKAGFDDYILKHPHHFPRMASAVRSALEDSARRRIASEAETRYRSLFEGVPVGLYRATLSGQILDANPALIRLLGFPSRESLMAVNLRDIHLEPKARRTLLERLEREGEVQDLELQWRRYGGQIITVRKSARPVRDPSGRLLHYEGVVEDITERKRSRQEVQESNQFRQEIISGAGEGIVVYDRDLRYMVWNRYMEQMTGLPTEKVIGRRPLDLLPFLREHGVDKLLERALAGQTASSGDIPYTIPDTKRSGWAIATYGPHRDASGAIVGVIGIVHDVTERRRAELALRESEERYRVVVETATDAVVTIDENSRILFANSAVEAIFGHTPAELQGQPLTRLMPEGLRPRHKAGIRNYLETGQRHLSWHSVQVPGLHKNGHEIPLELSFGEFIREGRHLFTGIIRDITQRRRAEEALRESEARYRIQIEHAPEAIVVLDADTGRFVEANENAVKLYGLPREALFRMGPAELSPPLQPDGRPSTEAAAERIEQTLNGALPVFDWTHRDAEGRDIPCEIRLVRLPSATRRLVRGSVADISSRKRSEKLRSALYRVAATASSAEDLDEFYAAIHGIVGELMYAKNFYVALHDAATQMLSFPYWVDEFDPPPEPRPLRRGLTEFVIRTGEPLWMPDEDFPAFIAREDVELVGSPSVDWLGVPLKRGGTTFGVLVVQSYDPRFRYGTAEKEVLTFVSQQIAVALERKRSQEAIRESEERYRLLFERNMAGVYRMTLAGRILECNDALAHMFGYSSREDLTFRGVRALYPAEQSREEFLEALLRTRQVVNYEMRGQRRDGTAVWTLENAALLADETIGEVIVEGTVTNITERKLLEEQLRQSQKMEAVGRLAGGIAHDFNNLLTTVLGYSDMALNQLAEEDPIRSEILEIRKAGERAANLTRQLLAFSRKQVFEPRTLDLNALIAESTRMLARLIGEHIHLVTQLDPSLGNVRADPGQVEQVIANLVVNARDAMPEGGTLTIRTRNADVEVPGTREHFGVAPGRYVVILVTDTGVGIDLETQKRIFEPFFTTKEKQGTGLGLATVYGIVSQSGGEIFVASEPGRGAAFAVYLPRVDGGVPEPLAAARSAPAGGSETILLVEDESAVRDLTRRCLEKSGYTVLQAASAEEALDVVGRHSGEIHLLLTDVIMPGASGPELARQLSSRRANLEILFVSGYTDETMTSQQILQPGASFLQKPFTPDSLARKVRDVLDRRATASIDG